MMNIMIVHLFMGLLTYCISISAQINYVTTDAGSGTGTYADGTGTAASFNHPDRTAIDPSGSI